MKRDRPQGRGPLRAHLLGRGARHHRGEVPRHRGVRRRAAGDPPLQLRRDHGPAAVRIDGPPLLPPPRRVAPRPHHLRDRRQGRLGRDHRRGDGDRRRAVRTQPADPDLGQQPDRVEPALLDPRAGGQAPRREADRDRSLPQRDGGEVPRARRAAAGHRRRAGAGHDARADRRGSARPRLHRRAHAGLRRPGGACRGVPARARRRDLRHRAGTGDRARARLRDDAAGGDPAQLRDAAPRRRRQRGAGGRLPAGAGRRVARSRRRGAAVVLGHLPGRRGGAGAPRPDPRRRRARST